MVIKIILAVVGLAGLLLVIGWAGLQAAASSFTFDLKSRDLGTAELPADLPAPVLRHARAVFGGDRVPVVESGVVVGRASIKRSGLTLNARIKISYDAKGDYYHYFQITWFGLPVIAINERYLDGKVIMDIPGQHIENDPHTDSAANQGFWSEALVWMPSVLFTDPRVRWEAVDDTTARLIIPNAAEEEMFTLHFDPETGLMSSLSTLRYGDFPQRVPWKNYILAWGEINGLLVPVRAETQWQDDPPWASWQIENIAYNVPVANRFNQFGGEYPEG